MKDFLTLPDSLIHGDELDEVKLFTFFDENPHYKNLALPTNIDGCNGMLTPNNCILNLLVTPKMKYWRGILCGSRVYEENLGGRIYYTGTKKEYGELVDSGRKGGMGADYTPYYDVVEFVDESFTLPEIDYHVITEFDEVIHRAVRYSTQSGEVTIPNSYKDKDGNEYEIDAVGMFSFAFNEGLEKVIIPANIKCIYQDAFRGCKNLREVYICDSDESIEIETGAFYACDKLQNVYIGREASIGKYVFPENIVIKTK